MAIDLKDKIMKSAVDAMAESIVGNTSAVPASWRPMACRQGGARFIAERMETVMRLHFANTDPRDIEHVPHELVRELQLRSAPVPASWDTLTRDTQQHWQSLTTYLFNVYVAWLENASSVDGNKEGASA